MESICVIDIYIIYYVYYCTVRLGGGIVRLDGCDVSGESMRVETFTRRLDWIYCPCRSPKVGKGKRICICVCVCVRSCVRMCVCVRDKINVFLRFY